MRIAEVTTHPVTFDHDRELLLMIDASEHFTVPTALRLAHALADLGVEWLEEPVPQHHRRGSEEVARRSPVPLAYGEHLFGASVPNVHLLEYAYPLAEAWAAFAPGVAVGPDALRAGELAPPPGPGLGVALDEGVLAAHPYRPPGPRPGLATRFVGEA